MAAKTLNEKMADILKVLNAIAPWRKANKGKSATDVRECPVCGGRLHLRIAACNGHVHAKCETLDCVAWME